MCESDHEGSRQITRVTTDEKASLVKQRANNSGRQQYHITRSREKNKNYDKMSLKWLAENYIWKNGLRSWTWEIIIQGIIRENILQI